MNMKRRVALNGTYLDSLDNRIVTGAVDSGDGKESISATDTAGGFGQRITGQHRGTVDLVVRFRILERGRSTSGMQNRAEVLEKINNWARPGGVLTVNYKPGRRLNVVLAQAPGEGSLWDFTKEFAITFRAYAIPYWEDATESSDEIGTSSVSTGDTLTVGGSAETQADVEVENTSNATADTVSITIGGHTMSFADLGLASGETLIIDHVDGLVRIRILNGTTYRNAMDKRTAASANDFLMAPGSVSATYTAAQTCTTTVKWRNRYL